jgi:hypothetical protein
MVGTQVCVCPFSKQISFAGFAQLPKDKKMTLAAIEWEQGAPYSLLINKSN